MPVYYYEKETIYLAALGEYLAFFGSKT